MAWLGALAEIHESQAKGEIGLEGESSQCELALVMERPARLAS